MLASIGTAWNQFAVLFQDHLLGVNLVIAAATALTWGFAAGGNGFKPRALLGLAGFGGWMLFEFILGSTYWRNFNKWNMPISPGWRTLWYAMLLAAWVGGVALFTPRIRRMMQSTDVFARVRNRAYTRYTLFVLFFSLVWVDFSFELMEKSFTSILKFRMLNELHAYPPLYKMFIGTLPALLNLFMNPIISMRSDRHRGPRGRRIPFLLYSTPFIATFLALLGFGNEIGTWLQAHVFVHFSSRIVLIWTFGLLFMVFYTFNLFVTVIFYYLFNDVVPQEHFVKFMAYMRVVGGLTGMLYQNYVYGFSNGHGPLNIDFGFVHYHNPDIWYPKLILVGMAIFFLGAFTLACAKIKEPEYPPPPPQKGRGPVERIVANFRTLFTECFSHRFYIIVFIALTVEVLFTAAADYQEPMLLSLGVPPKVMGPINSSLTPLNLTLFMIAATFGDRWHPVPLMLVGTIGVVLTAPVGLAFLIPASFFTSHFTTHWRFLHEPAHAYLFMRIAYTISHIPVGLITGLAVGPFTMRLYPRERFGQYSAAGNMVRILFANIIGGQLAAWFIAGMQKLTSYDYGLRFCFVWQMFFQVIALVCYYVLYREWKRLGGKQNYKPPGSTPAAAAGPVPVAISTPAPAAAK